jgi:hypothetical protein
MFKTTRYNAPAQKTAGATMTIHDLKSWSQFFQPIKSGAKKHDLRKNDRQFKVGDLCRLREYDFAKGEYTNDEVTAEVTFITDKQFPCAFSSAVLPPDYCILSLEVKNDAN